MKIQQMELNLTDNSLLDEKTLNIIWDEEKSLYEIQKSLEMSNTRRQANAAYYTDSELVADIVNSLPNFIKQKNLKILEPAVGVGNFIWKLASVFNERNLEITVVDIDERSLLILKELLKRFPIKNAQFKFIHNDFLALSFNEKQFDLVIGNPPFKKVSRKNFSFSTLSDNLATIFLQRSLYISKIVSLILPKGFLSTPSMDNVRDVIGGYEIKEIIDFGEKGFKGVKIETIALILNSSVSNIDVSNTVIVKSWITNDIRMLKQHYICDTYFPYWLIYRNSYFDSIAKKMDFDKFFVFRDRSITKKNTSNTSYLGKLWVLKSRNILDDGNIIHLPGYDTFIDIKYAQKLSVYKFLNKKVYMMPNLTYHPRSSMLPKNTIVDGSVALLIPKKGTIVSKEDLAFYSSSKFRKFYKIARNFGTRSLNIDRNSVFFFGVNGKQTF